MLAGCSHQNTIELLYKKEGKIHGEEIVVNHYLNQEKRISTFYIDSVKFSVLDSISFQDENPDKIIDYSSPVELRFENKIELNSPEYYAIATAHYTSKSINYYNSVFDGKIDFNQDAEYKNLVVQFGDIDLLTTPKRYIFEKGDLLSPSIFYHEVGHRAFWFLDDVLEINFGGLTYIHMGLLEYFTASLNNSPVVGEDVLPSKLVRNVALPYRYPFADSLLLSSSMQLLKESYAEEIKDSSQNISKYINLTLKTYGDVLNVVYDNHRTGLIITSTLWHIRERLGQEKTDKLVAQTILNLNKYQSQREKFYTNDKDETLSKKIDWYDLFFGLIQKDRELFRGENADLIKNEFETTGFPVQKIRITNTNQN